MVISQKCKKVLITVLMLEKVVMQVILNSKLLVLFMDSIYSNLVYFTFMNNRDRLILHVCFLITLFLALHHFSCYCRKLECPNRSAVPAPIAPVASVPAPDSSVASAEKAIILTASNDNLVDYTSQGLLLIMQNVHFCLTNMFLFLVNMHNSKKII